MAKVELKGIGKVYDGNVRAVDNANITILASEEWGYSNGIYVSGDLTVKGGNLKMVAYDDSKTTHYEGKDSGYNLNASAFYNAVLVKKSGEKGGNFIVQDGANVSLAVSVASNAVDADKRMIATEGTFTIKDSTVELGLIGKCVDGSKLFTAKPTLEFADGYTVTATKTKKPAVTVSNPEVDGAVLNAYIWDATMTYDATKLVDWAETTSLGSITYFKVVAGGSGSGSGTGTGSGTGSNNPNTGGISVLLTAGIALASAVGFGGVTVLRKKEN